MELPESGNVKDLVRYRIEMVKSDLQSAQILIREWRVAYDFISRKQYGCFQTTSDSSE